MEKPIENNAAPSVDVPRLVREGDVAMIGNVDGAKLLCVVMGPRREIDGITYVRVRTNEQQEGSVDVRSLKVLPKRIVDYAKSRQRGFPNAEVISVFVSFPTGERIHERFATRKAAAAGIRDARFKGGFDINVFDPWTKRSEAQNAQALAQPGRKETL